MKESDFSSRPRFSMDRESELAAKQLQRDAQGLQSYKAGLGMPSIGEPARSMGYFASGAGLKPEIRVQSDCTSNSGGDEEADNHTMTRMLEDDTGRLVYIGDASTLSVLPLIRMIVETTAGPSPFTMDPERHKIEETPFSLPPDTKLSHLLPEKQTALILVDCFFINVSSEPSRSSISH